MMSTTAPSLAAAFDRMAARQPGRIAIDDGRSALTYADLRTASLARAETISRYPLADRARLGVMAHRDVETVVSMLAGLRLGRAFVPLDPAQPAERTRFILTDAEIGLVIDRAAIDGGDAHASEVVPVPLPGPTPSSPAYVIYTSGTTGRPKGCEITQGNVLSLLESTLPLLGLAESDRWSVFHSFGFDFSVWELWGALLSGATAVIVPEPVARASDEFANFLWLQRITVLNQVPSAFRALTAAAALNEVALPELRLVIFGGEAVNLDVVRRFQKLPGTPSDTRLINMYGITEITVHATMKDVTEPADVVGTAPIGVALPHLRIELRDEKGQPVGPEETGEIWVFGSGVGCGYVNQPELTAERFGAIDGDRFYRSGDLARLTPDGELDYRGRADGQVKLRGYRIELDEISAVARDSQLIVDAAAVLTTRANGAGSIALFYVPGAARPDPAMIEADLRRVIGIRLPAYMAPSRYLSIESIPLTGSGKLDRARLARIGTVDRQGVA